MVYSEHDVACMIAQSRWSIVSCAIQEKWVRDPEVEKKLCHWLIEPCIVATAIKPLCSPLASKHFMRAED